MSCDWRIGVRDPVRVAALERSGLAGTGPDDAFDRLTELAALLVAAPRSFVTLVDAERYGYKSAVGLGEGYPRRGLVEQSFCRYVVGSGRPLIVDDAAADPRTSDNPAIKLHGVAAWAGYPIEDPSGAVLGTFCVADTSPHAWSDRDIQIVATLARVASSEIALIVARGQVAALVEAAAVAEVAARTERSETAGVLREILRGGQQAQQLGNDLLQRLTH